MLQSMGSQRVGRDRVTEQQSLVCDKGSGIFFTWSCLTLLTPWTAAYQASLSIASSWSLLKLMSIESVMPSNHLILCCPLVLLPSIFPSIRVFSNESVIHIRWPKDWGFSFSISPSTQDWFPLGVARSIRQFSSVQFSHSVMSDSLWPHGLQDIKLPCLSPSLGVWSDSHCRQILCLFVCLFFNLFILVGG